MKIKISRPTVLFEDTFTENDFDMFHSMTHVDGIDYTFARNVKNHQWMNSMIKIDDDLIGLGEDPRAFDMMGVPACYSVRFNEWERFVPQLYFKIGDEWSNIQISMSDGLPAGKNWGPFVYNSEIYFVHEVSPFRVLKLVGDKVETVFVKEVPCDVHLIDKYPVLRSGSNGLEVKPGIILGFGHDNYASSSSIFSLKHRPFAWILDMNTNDVEIQYLEIDWDEKFQIIDSSSFFVKDGQYYLMTSEGETNQAKVDQVYRPCIYPITITD
jgi:hypothetical protein